MGQGRIVADLYQQQTIAATTTDWSTNLQFAQFDPSIGSLQGVNVWLDGQVTGNVSIENLEAAPASVAVSLFGTIDLGGPGGTNLLSIGPDASASVNLGAYDGDTDYAGNSGTVVGLSGESFNQATLSAGIAGLVGTGTLALPVSAQTSLSVTGPANLLLAVGAAASAAVALDYDYMPAVDAGGVSTDGDFTYLADYAGDNGAALPVGSLDPANPGETPVQTPVQVFDFADSTAGWINDVVAQQFDPSLGTLEAVNLTVSADLLASVAAENLDASASTVSTTQTVDVTLTLPASGTAAAVAIVPPVSAEISDTMNLGGYDGTTDFGGTSGRIDQGLTRTGTASTSLTGSEMTAFLGLGTIDLPIATFGSSTAEGPGNLLLSLLADAGATVTLSYTYLPTESVWATPDVAITQGGTYSVENAQTVQSLVLDAPGATVVLDAPLDVTGGFTLEAGTLVFDGGTLSVGSYLQDGGVVTGGNVNIVAADVFAENGGSIVTKGTVDITAGTTMTLGTIVASALEVVGPAGAVVPMGDPVPTTGVITLQGGTLVPDGSPSSPSVVADDSGSVPPVVTAGGAASYQAGGAPIALDAGLTVSDAETSFLSSATIAISAGFLLGDVLSVGTAEAGIISSYNAATGVLTLDGPASVAAYQTELDAIIYVAAGDPTDGGADPARSITWSVNDGAAASAPATSSLSVTFASDPGSDLLFQNTDGQMVLWQMNGLSIAAWGAIGPDPGPDWFAMGTGAFFAGDTSDILWQANNGAVELWRVQGTTLLGGDPIAANPGPSWHIAGTGYFYGDGNTDILWQNDSGQVALWDMSGTNIVQADVLAADPGPSWHIEGTADFYGDGNTDILWQNDNGQVALWDMNGSNIVQADVVAANPGPSWQIKGTGDFFGDGNTDILWQNTDGQVDIWDMTGSIISQAIMLPDPGPSWHIAGTGDFNHDGNTDIALQSDSGAVSIWELNGTTVTASGVVASPGTAWNIIDGTMRFIYSTAANETLTATPAAPDEFVFTNAAAGSYAITGFNPVQDMIELSNAQFASYVAVQAATSATAAGALLNLGGGSSLLLQGIDPASLQAHDFVLG